jgi:hypothetical protein
VNVQTSAGAPFPAERAAPVLPPLAVGLAQLALAAVEDVPGESVAARSEVAHALDLAPIRLVVEVVQNVHRLWRSAREQAPHRAAARVAADVLR